MNYHKLTLTNIHEREIAFIFDDLDKAKSRFAEYLRKAEEDKEKFGATISSSNNHIRVHIQIYYNSSLVKELYWSVELSTNLGFDQ